MASTPPVFTSQIGGRPFSGLSTIHSPSTLSGMKVHDKSVNTPLSTTSISSSVFSSAYSNTLSQGGTTITSQSLSTQLELIDSRIKTVHNNLALLKSKLIFDKSLLSQSIAPPLNGGGGDKAGAGGIDEGNHSEHHQLLQIPAHTLAQTTLKAIKQDFDTVCYQLEMWKQQSQQQGEYTQQLEILVDKHQHVLTGFQKCDDVSIEIHTMVQKYSEQQQQQQQQQSHQPQGQQSTNHYLNPPLSTLSRPDSMGGPGNTLQSTRSSSSGYPGNVAHLPPPSLQPSMIQQLKDSSLAGRSDIATPHSTTNQQQHPHSQASQSPSVSPSASSFLTPATASVLRRLSGSDISSFSLQSDVSDLSGSGTPTTTATPGTATTVPNNTTSTATSSAVATGHPHNHHHLPLTATPTAGSVGISTPTNSTSTRDPRGMTDIGQLELMSVNPEQYLMPPPQTSRHFPISPSEDSSELGAVMGGGIGNRDDGIGGGRRSNGSASGGIHGSSSTRSMFDKQRQFGGHRIYHRRSGGSNDSSGITGTATNGGTGGSGGHPIDDVMNSDHYHDPESFPEVGNNDGDNDDGDDSCQSGMLMRRKLASLSSHDDDTGSVVSTMSRHTQHINPSSSNALHSHDDLFSDHGSHQHGLSSRHHPNYLKQSWKARMMSLYGVGIYSVKKVGFVLAFVTICYILLTICRYLFPSTYDGIHQSMEWLPSMPTLPTPSSLSLPSLVSYESWGYGRSGGSGGEGGDGVINDSMPSIGVASPSPLDNSAHPPIPHHSNASFKSDIHIVPASQADPYGGGVYAATGDDDSDDLHSYSHDGDDDDDDAVITRSKVQHIIAKQQRQQQQQLQQRQQHEADAQHRNTSINDTIGSSQDDIKQQGIAPLAVETPPPPMVASHPSPSPSVSTPTDSNTAQNPTTPQEATAQSPSPQGDATGMQKQSHDGPSTVLGHDGSVPPPSQPNANAIASDTHKSSPSSPPPTPSLTGVGGSINSTPSPNTDTPTTSQSPSPPGRDTTVLSSYYEPDGEDISSSDIEPSSEGGYNNSDDESSLSEHINIPIHTGNPSPGAAIAAGHRHPPQHQQQQHPSQYYHQQQQQSQQRLHQHHHHHQQQTNPQYYYHHQQQHPQHRHTSNQPHQQYYQHAANPSFNSHHHQQHQQHQQQQLYQAQLLQQQQEQQYRERLRAHQAALQRQQQQQQQHDQQQQYHSRPTQVGANYYRQPSVSQVQPSQQPSQRVAVPPPVYQYRYKTEL